jgi:hypothetical protein
MDGTLQAIGPRTRKAATEFNSFTNAIGTETTIIATMSEARRRLTPLEPAAQSQGREAHTWTWAGFWSYDALLGSLRSGFRKQKLRVRGERDRVSVFMVAGQI